MSVKQQNRRYTILLGEDNNALLWLIIMNAVVFVLLIFLRIFYNMEYDTPMEQLQNFKLQITDFVYLPASADTLASRPWTLLTYMFSQENTWEMLGTVLWLGAFGYILQDLTGTTKIIPIYLYGGFFGGIFFILASNLIPQLRETLATTAPLSGAGAAVMAIAVATTTTAPGYRIFPMINGGIPLWILLLIFLGIDYAFIASGSAATAIAHVAGAAIGFLYIKQMNRGYDMGAWMVSFYEWVNDLFNPAKKYRRKPVTQQRFYKVSRKPFEKTPRITQQKLDEILDKINEEGYHSLSDEEKEFLKKASKEDI